MNLCGCGGNTGVTVAFMDSGQPCQCSRGPSALGSRLPALPCRGVMTDSEGSPVIDANPSSRSRRGAGFQR